MSEQPGLESPRNNNAPHVVVLPDNQIAVVGRATLISEKLKEAGGEYNRASQPARGWIFSADKMDTVNQILAEAAPSEATANQAGSSTGESSHAQAGSSEAMIPHAPMDVMKKDDTGSEGVKAPPAHVTRSQSHSSQQSIGEGAPETAHAEASEKPSSSSQHTEDVAHATRSHDGADEPAQTTTATETKPTSSSRGAAPEHTEVEAGQAAITEPAQVEQAHVPEPSPQGAPSSGPYIVQLGARTIGVLGDTDAYKNKLSKITGGKFSKALHFGDNKVPGWSFAKKHLPEVQKIIPGVQMQMEQGGGMKAGGGAQGSSGEASPMSPGGSAHKKQRLEKPSESQHSVPEA